MGHLVEGFRVFYDLLLIEYFVEVDEVKQNETHGGALDKVCNLLEL